MQDATPIIAIRNAIPATGYPRVDVRASSTARNHEKRRALLDSSRAALIYVQGTCAQAHLVNPKTGKVLGTDDE